jgi:hypothetical protein
MTFQIVETRFYKARAVILNCLLLYFYSTSIYPNIIHSVKFSPRIPKKTSKLREKMFLELKGSAVLLILMFYVALVMNVLFTFQKIFFHSINTVVHNKVGNQSK